MERLIVSFCDSIRLGSASGRGTFFFPMSVWRRKWYKHAIFMTKRQAGITAVRIWELNRLRDHASLPVAGLATAAHILTKINRSNGRSWVPNEGYKRNTRVHYVGILYYWLSITELYMPRLQLILNLWQIKWTFDEKWQITFLTDKYNVYTLWQYKQLLPSLSAFR